MLICAVPMNLGAMGAAGLDPTNQQMAGSMRGESSQNAQMPAINAGLISSMANA